MRLLISWYLKGLLPASSVFSGNIIFSYSFTDITVVQTFYNSTFKMQNLAGEDNIFLVSNHKIKKTLFVL